ncbi:MAG: hypothetical protein GXY53_08975 [Desulfobulbus sp.]|nr:hypothetical protein [Desulfobulbus sp.]
MRQQAAIVVVTLFLSALFPLLPAAYADDLPPPGGRPLSSILRSVEAQQKGTITEAEFDDGLWEVKVCRKKRCEKLYLSPYTADEVRRKRTRSDATPPKGATPVSAIVRSIEAQRLGIITEVEFENGVWEVKLRKHRQKIKIAVDPMSHGTWR